MFAGNGQPIGPNNIEDTNQPTLPTIAYPAMLVFDGDRLTTIGRDDILAYPGFPIFGVRFYELIPYPGEGGWVSYDAGSGELLRLTVREKM